MIAFPLGNGVESSSPPLGPTAIIFFERQRLHPGRGLILCGLFALRPSVQMAGGCRAFSFI